MTPRLTTPIHCRPVFRQTDTDISLQSEKVANSVFITLQLLLLFHPIPSSVSQLRYVLVRLHSARAGILVPDTIGVTELLCPPAYLCCCHLVPEGSCTLRCSRKPQIAGAHRLLTAVYSTCPQKVFCLLEQNKEMLTIFQKERESQQDSVREY